jgi:hypothetical protein
MTNRRPQANVRIPLALLLCALCSTALADEQSERIKILEKRLETSVRLIDELSTRVKDLEEKARSQTRAVSAIAAAPAASSVAAAARPASAPADDLNAPSVATLQEQVDQINDSLSKRGNDYGLPVHGFADVKAVQSSAGDPLPLKGFNAGTLDLYLTPQFGNRVRSLIEIAIEYERDSNNVTVDMERLQLGYTASDELTVWLGRFHTPFGLWNTAFHHGANLQTSIYRPRFIEFEDQGGIIPAHSVGFWASGRVDLGAARLTYDGYLSNGPSIRDRELDFNPFTDDTSGKMVGFNLGLQPSGALRGLSAGLHGFTSKAAAVTPSGVTFDQTRLRMVGAYAAYDAFDWEVFAEYYRFGDSELSNDRRHTSSAGFIHAGRSFDQWTPYARYERAALDAGDVYFSSQRVGRSYTRYVVGSRYALDARSSVKLELSRTVEPSLNQFDEGGGIVFAPRASYRRAALQYSIAF